MTDSHIDALAKQYDDERATWRAVALAGQRLLQYAVAQVGVPAVRTSAREKDLHSVVGKSVENKNKPLEEFSDLAGARCVVMFKEEVAAVVNYLTTTYDLAADQIDWKQPEVDALAYQGCHIDMVFDDRATALDGAADLRDGRPLICELQVRTAAQDMWSDLSHQVAYKKNVSASAQRRINRLVALAEIVDDEAERAASELMEKAQFAEALWLTASKLYRSMRGIEGTSPSRESDLLDVLAESIPAAEQAQYSDTLRRFALGDRRSVVTAILEDEELSRQIPVAALPEVLIVLERLDTAPALLRSKWAPVFQTADLDRLVLRLS